MALGVLAKTTDPAISRVFHDLDDRGNVLAHYTTSPLKGIASQWWALSDLNGRPFGCKPNALTAELSALSNSSYKKRQEASTRRRMTLFILGESFAKASMVGSSYDSILPN